MKATHSVHSITHGPRLHLAFELSWNQRSRFFAAAPWGDGRRGGENIRRGGLDACASVGVESLRPRRRERFLSKN
jgi:hypothetical protein